MKKFLVIFCMISLFALMPAHNAAWGQNGDNAEEEYHLTTFRNLSQLYWKIGMHSINDNMAIDNYMRINECPIYLDYYQNEFEWRRIRDAARKSIKQKIENDEFPQRFEIIRPIYLGKYNYEDEYFELKNSSKMNNITRVEVVTNTVQEICGRKREIEGYPVNIILILSPPLELTKLPVERELAKLYLDRVLRDYEALPDNVKKRYKDIRPAYLRLKVKILQYKETIHVGTRTDPAGNERAVVFGHLEGFEVYADEELEMPLFYKKVEFKRARRYKQRRDKQRAESREDQPAAEDVAVEEIDEEETGFND